MKKNTFSWVAQDKIRANFLGVIFLINMVKKDKLFSPHYILGTHSGWQTYTISSERKNGQST